LILATCAAFVLYLACQTVGVSTDGTLEHIDLVFIDAPTSAVRRTAVETLRLTRLSFLDA